MRIQLNDKYMEYDSKNACEALKDVMAKNNNESSSMVNEYYKQNDVYNITKHMEIAGATDYDIYDESVVKVTKYKNGNIDIQDNLNYNRQHNVGNIIWKSKDERLNTETGETIQCKEAEEYRSNESITNSMRKCKKLILNNFNGDKNELFITLTYRDVVEDFDTIKNDIEGFCDKLRENYNGIQYMYVIEIQEKRLSWHAHLIIKDTQIEKTKITNIEINGLWKKGETKTKKVYNINGLANYMCKTRSKDIKEIANNNNKFKIKKGRRMYGCSKGITKPEENLMLYKEAKELVRDKQHKGNTTYRVVQVTEYKNELTNDVITDEKTFNKIKVEHYKNKRNKNK